MTDQEQPPKSSDVTTLHIFLRGSLGSNSCATNAGHFKWSIHELVVLFDVPTSKAFLKYVAGAGVQTSYVYNCL
jgi:hypothetical protein